MNKLKSKYRCFYPFDDNGKPVASDVNNKGEKRYDQNDAMMYCHNGKIYITKMDRDTLRIVIFGQILHQLTLSKMKKANIKIKDEYCLDGEGFIDFYYEDMDKVAPIVKAKKNNKYLIGLTHSSNYNYYLRIMRNVCSGYGEILKSRGKQK